MGALEPPRASAGSRETSLAKRFPALQNILVSFRSRTVPYISQVAAADCGAACLAMVLGYWGKRISLADVHEIVGAPTHGTSAATLVKSARKLGLIGRGVKVDTRQYSRLDRGNILHWEFRHFVVFDGLSRKGVKLVDPAYGRREVSVEQFNKAFTGIALQFSPAEDFTSTPGTSRGARYLQALLEERSNLMHILGMSGLLQLFVLAFPSLTGAVVDRVIPNGDRELLWILAASMAMMIGFQFLASWIRAHLLVQLRSVLDIRMTVGFLDRLVRLPFPFFQARSTGDLLNRVTSTAIIREILTASVLSACIDASLVSICIILLFVGSWKIGLLGLVLALLQIAVYIGSRKKQRDLMADDLERSARLRSFEIEMFSGIQSLKAMGIEDQALQHWTSRYVDAMNVALERGRVQGWVESANSALRMGSPLTVLCVGTILVLNGELSLGHMLALNALAVGFLTPISNLVTAASQLQLISVYLERIEDVMKVPPEDDAEEQAECPTLTGKIELKEISFRFSANSPWIIQNVSATIEPGQFIALVGASGAGKSTLANLMLGLYRPQLGTIRFDGLDVRGFNLQSLRNQIGVVLQNPSLFQGDIRRNIALADASLSTHQIELAAKRAHIHDEIMSMPMGYNTIVQEMGTNLSGGQRQRIAIARALVREPSIVLFDEATNALDAKAERAVQDAVSQLSCTRIVIAHRLSTVRAADSILVLHNGRIIEQGTHNELVSRGGRYAEFVELNEPREAVESAVPS